jgi:hypothetical protein
MGGWVCVGGGIPPQARADPARTTAEGQTPLHLAAAAGRLSAVVRLCAAVSPEVRPLARACSLPLPPLIPCRHRPALRLSSSLSLSVSLSHHPPTPDPHREPRLVRPPAPRRTRFPHASTPPRIGLCALRTHSASRARRAPSPPPRACVSLRRRRRRDDAGTVGLSVSSVSLCPCRQLRSTGLLIRLISPPRPRLLVALPAALCSPREPARRDR